MPERPLSPYWVYKFGYTMTLSILHRLAGMLLAVALVGLTAWLVSVSLGRDAYEAASVVWSSWPWKVVVALAAIALVYHFCNGVRHLFWDLGVGFERAAARRSAALVVTVAVLASAVCLYFLFRGAVSP